MLYDERSIYMHYLTLVTVEIPKVEQEPEIDKRIQEELNKLKSGNNNGKNFMTDIYIERLNGLSNAFARCVDSEICSVLEPYAEQTDNPEYLEFEDHTEELRNEYENDCIDCIKLPNGKIVSIENRMVWDKFIIGDDGKVYQKYFGQLKRPKRSKKAKKMKALKNYPYKKLYKNFNAFAENEKYIYYNEYYNGYGYVYNPNAFYDWYSIGGRWPFLFLVKDSCTEYSVGEKSWCSHEEQSAPKGYKWVCKARKKDIEWNVMYRVAKENATKRFKILEKAFLDKKLPEGCYGRITENGITGFWDFQYKKDETLQQFLARNRIIRKYKYPNFACAYLIDGEYASEDSFNFADKNKRNRAWHKNLNRQIDALNEDTVLVGVDCHI